MKQSNRDQAKRDYEKGMKYKEIAEKYGVSISTVKSWKARYWKNATSSKKVASKIKKVATKSVDDLVKDDGLTDKQKQFCLLYLQSFNATQAYMKAYDVDYETSMTNGSRMLRNAQVKKHLANLKKDISASLHVTAEDIASEYAKQAFSDVGDYIRFGSWPEQLEIYDADTERSIPLLDADGNTVIRHNSYVYFNDDQRVDTSLIKSVKMGKDGPVVELYDKQKAMSELLKYLDTTDNDSSDRTVIVDDIPDE